MVCVSRLSHSDYELHDQPPVVFHVTIKIECPCSGRYPEHGHNQQVSELQKEIQEKAGKIDELQQESEEKTEKIEELEQDKENLQRENKFLKQELQDHLSQSDPESPDGESRADRYDRKDPDDWL